MKRREIIKLITEAREAATFERANFHTFERDSTEKDSELKERTRLYRDTWVLGPLDEALKLLEDGK